MPGLPSTERRIIPGNPEAAYFGRRSSDKDELRRRLMPAAIADHSKAIEPEMLGIIAARSIGGNRSVDYLQRREILAPKLSVVFKLHVFRLRQNLSSVIDVGILRESILRDKRTAFYGDAMRMLTDDESTDHTPPKQSLQVAENTQQYYPELGFAASLSSTPLRQVTAHQQLLHDLAADYVAYGVQTLSEMQRQRSNVS